MFSKLASRPHTRSTMERSEVLLMSKCMCHGGPDTGLMTPWYHSR